MNEKDQKRDAQPSITDDPFYQTLLRRQKELVDERQMIEVREMELQLATSEYFRHWDNTHNPQTQR